MEPSEIQPPADPHLSIANQLSAWLRVETGRKLSTGILVGIGATWLVIRFCGLGTAPPGFFVDEATPALHAMCLAETGKNAVGEPWPLYSPAAGNMAGQHTLALLSLDVIWLKGFGTSRVAFRAVSAFLFLVTALGLFFLAREIASMAPHESRAESGMRPFPWLVLLAALVSPWSFQFSRIGWDPPVGPTYMVLSLVGMVRSYRGGRWAVAWSAFTGFCAAASMTAYAPLRAVVPLVLTSLAVLLFVLRSEWRARWGFIRSLLVAAFVAAILLAPTLRMLSTGEINQRMNNIAIWNPSWIKEHAGSMHRPLFLVMTFLDNVVAHLQPSFLFIKGDANIRHSAHIAGHLSPVDMVALLCVLWFGLALLLRLVRGRAPFPAGQAAGLPTYQRWLTATALCAALGWFFGIVPAALTWDGLPQALRAIAAWPFVALFTGAVLALAWSRRRWMPAVLAVVALAHTVYFLPAYFRAFDKTETYWFMREMVDLIEKNRHETSPKPIPQLVSQNLGLGYGYDEMLRYFLMHDGGMRCDEATAAVRAYWKAARGE